MIIRFLRESSAAAYLLVIARLYLGWAWLSAGWGKVVGDFDATGYLHGAVEQATGEHPAVQSWWAAFLENVAIPNVGLFNFLVAWGEVLVGIGLILGVFTTFSALMGMAMNFAFLFSGTTSTNPQMVLITIFVLIAGYNAARIGLDRWIIPAIRSKVLVKGEKVMN